MTAFRLGKTRKSHFFSFCHAPDRLSQLLTSAALRTPHAPHSTSPAFSVAPLFLCINFFSFSAVFRILAFAVFAFYHSVSVVLCLSFLRLAIRAFCQLPLFLSLRPLTAFLAFGISSASSGTLSLSPVVRSLLFFLSISQPSAALGSQHLSALVGSTAALPFEAAAGHCSPSLALRLLLLRRTSASGWLPSIIQI